MKHWLESGCPGPGDVCFLGLSLSRIDPRSNGIQIPQSPPGLQEAEEVLVTELLVPLIFEAKVEICFATWRLSQNGQTTSSTALALRTSSSKGVPQSWQTNSKIGIHFSL
jgi:hypothetical protein